MEETLSFPLWLRINHVINLFCMFLLMRSGVQILADHPKLYWNDGTTPGSEWAHFGTKVMPKEFIAPAGNDVTPAFVQYAKPLLGSGFPGMHRLRAPKVDKILKK